MNFSSQWLRDREAREGSGDAKPCPPGLELHILHRFVRDECKRRGWICRYSDPTRKSTLFPAGTEDFEIMADGGRVIRIECKTEEGDLFPAQHEYQCWARGLGHVIHVCRSEAEILEAMGL